MKGKTILVSVVILLCSACFAQAQEGELHGNVGLTYLSSYIWRGFDYYADDHSALHSNIGLDLYGTGIGVNILFSRAISAPFENAERISIALSYGNSLFDGENYATNYTTSWVYYGFPDEPRSGSKTSAHAQAADMQEYVIALSWPEICPAGIVPSYTAVSMWPSEGDSAARHNSGWAHIAGLGYDFTASGLVPEMPEQVFHLSAAMVYNDGMAPGVVVNTGGIVDHDWSHAVFGISTNFDLGKDLTFTPALYYQSSWEDTVNTEDQAWVSLGLKYAF